MTQNTDIVIFDNSKDIKDPVWTCVKQALEKRMKMLEEGGYRTSDEYALAKERYTGLTYKDVTIEEPIYFTDGRVQVCMVSRKTGFGRVDILIDKVTFLDVAREFGLKILQVNTRKQLENLIEVGSVQEHLIHLAYSDEYVMMIPGVNIKAEVEEKLDHIFFINATMSTSPLDYNNYTTAVLNLKDPSIPDTPIKIIKVNEVQDLIKALEVEVRPTQVTPYALTENVELEVPVVIDNYDKDVLSPLVIHSVRTKNGSIIPTEENLKFVIDAPGKSGKFVFKSLFDLEKDHIDDELFIVLETTSPNLPEGMTIQTDEISIKFDLTYDRIRLDIREVEVSNELGNRDLTFKLYDKLKGQYIAKDLVGYDYVLDGKWIKPNGKAVYSKAKGKFVYPVTTTGWGDATITMTGNQRNTQGMIRTDVPAAEVKVEYLNRVFTKPDQLTISMKVSYHNGLIPRVVELMNPFHTTTNCFEDTKVPTSVVYDKATGICKFTFKIVPPSNERKEYRFISNTDLLDEGVSKQFDFKVAIEQLEPQPSIELHDMTIEDRVATARYRVTRSDGTYPESITMITPFKTAENTTGGIKTPSSAIYNSDTGFCTFTFPVVMDTTQNMTYTFESEVWFINEDNKFPFKFTKTLAGGRPVAVIQNFFNLEGDVAKVQLKVSYPDTGEKPVTSVLKKPFDATSNTLDGTLNPTSDSYDPVSGVHSFEFPIVRNDEVAREYRFRSSVSITDKDGYVSIKPFTSGGDKHPAGGYVTRRNKMAIEDGDLVLSLFVEALPGSPAINTVSLRKPLTAIAGTLNNTIEPSIVVWNSHGGFITMRFPAYINRFEDVLYAVGGELLVNDTYSPSFMEQFVWTKAAVDTLTVTNLPTIETETELKFKYKVRYNEDLIPPAVTLKVPFDTASNLDVSDKTPTSTGYDPETGEGFFVFPYTKDTESKTAYVTTTVTDGKFNITSNVSNSHLIKPRYKLVCTPQASRVPKKYYRIDGQTYVEFSFTVASTDGSAISSPTATVTPGSLVTNPALKKVTWDSGNKEFTLLCEATAVKGLGLTVDGKVVETGGKDGVFTVILDIPEETIPDEVVTARIDVTQLEAKLVGDVCTFNFKAAYNTGDIPKRGTLVVPFTRADYTAEGTKDPMEPFVYNEQTGFGNFKFKMDMAEGLPVTRHFVSKFTWPGVSGYETAFDFTVAVGAKTTFVTTVTGNKPDGTYINEVMLTLVNDQGAPYVNQNVQFVASGGAAVENPTTVTDINGVAKTKVKSGRGGIFDIAAVFLDSRILHTNVSFMKEMPTGAMFSCNGKDFPMSLTSFPTTGFTGANFTVRLPDGLLASGYDWSVDKDWVTVTPEGLVTFVAEPSPEDRKFSLTIVDKSTNDYLGHNFALNVWFKPGENVGKTLVEAEAFAASLGGNYRVPHNKALSDAVEGQLGTRDVGSLYSEWGNIDSYPGWPSSAKPFWSSTERSPGVNNVINFTNGGNVSSAPDGSNNVVAGSLLNKENAEYIDIGLNSNGFDMPLTKTFPTTGFVGANFQIRLRGKSSEASKYDWTSSQAWVSVDPTGKVTFVASPNVNNRHVVITATNKTNPTDIVKYKFSISKWFAFINEDLNFVTTETRVKDLGPGWSIPPVKFVSAAVNATGPILPVPQRTAGTLYGEWGNLLTIGNGIITKPSHWCSDIRDSGSKRYVANLEDGSVVEAIHTTVYRGLGYRDVTVSPPVDSRTKFLVNAGEFPVAQGFPTTGFDKAKFRIAMLGDVANNTNYTFKVDRDWLSIDADGYVTFNSKPTAYNNKVTMTFTSKLTGETTQYVFTIKLWFKRTGTGQPEQGHNLAASLGPNWRSPHPFDCTPARAVSVAVNGVREIGTLCGEWGDMASFGWPATYFWTGLAMDASQQYLVALAGASIGIGNGSSNSYGLMAVEELVPGPIAPPGTEIVINGGTFSPAEHVPTSGFVPNGSSYPPTFTINLARGPIKAQTNVTWESNRDWCTVDQNGVCKIIREPTGAENTCVIKMTHKSTGTVYEYSFKISRYFKRRTEEAYKYDHNQAIAAYTDGWKFAKSDALTYSNGNVQTPRKPGRFVAEWGNMKVNGWSTGSFDSMYVDEPWPGNDGKVVLVTTGGYGGGGVPLMAWLVKDIV